MMALRKRHFEIIVLNLKIVPLLRRLQILDDACNDIEGYYHEYDFQGVPCNGFRTFVKIVDLYFASLARYSRQKVRRKSLIMEYETLARLLCNNAEAAPLIRRKGLNYPIQCMDADCEILEKFVAIEPEHMRPLFANIGVFYVKRDFKQDVQQTLAVMHMMTASSLFQKLRMLFSPRYRSRVQSSNAVTMTMTEAMGMRNLNQFPMNILFHFAPRPAGVSSRWVRVPRDKSHWIVRLPDVRSPAVLVYTKSARDEEANETKEENKEKGIRCLVINPKVRRDSQSVMMHVPSGAFITFSAKGYVPLMSRISSELGVPVFVPEYSKAPENPYPAAVQDVLDVYLFLTSGDQRVCDLIGFHPQRILLSGDSAGGQLVTVLTIALNEIRRSGAAVQMPKGLALQYTAAIPGFVATPGCILSGLDTFVTIALSRLTATHYAECEPKLDHKEQQSQKHVINRFEIMKRFNDRLQDPLYNPVVYQWFEEMKDIPMSILACEMDSLVDHSVAIANKWKGRVSLDMARGLPHAFMIGRETRALDEELRRLIRRLADGLAF